MMPGLSVVKQIPCLCFKRENALDLKGAFTCLFKLRKLVNVSMEPLWQGDKKMMDLSPSIIICLFWMNELIVISKVMCVY